jgi:protein involved in polysaccharide export with SLBB domain
MRCSVFVSFFILSVIALCQEGTAQTRDATDIPDIMSLRQNLPSAVRQPELPSVSMDGPVKPESYFVGPGDVLGVNVWSSTPVQQRVIVSPEATVLVPGVGEIVVQDLTLAQTKTLIAQAVARKFVRASVTVTLLMPRSITVEIVGQVIQEGKKEISAIQRADDLIALSNKFPESRLSVDDYALQLSALRKGTSERNIAILRRNGEILRVDLVRYRVTNDSRFNPYLREGDVVQVPPRAEADNTIAVFGGRMRPANFEFVPGDSLSMLIRMAFGFTQGTDPEHAFLTRLTPDAREMDTLRVNALAVDQDRAPDMPLRPGDRLVIPERSDPRQNFRVMVDGEVNRPGTYPTAFGGSRLSDIIHLAGGFTRFANLKAAVLDRRGVEERMGPELSNVLLTRQIGLTATDSADYLREMRLRLRHDAVAVDFYRLFVQGDSTQDIIVQPYDRIVIPRLEGTVYVFGQVVNPGNVPFKEAEKVDFYVDMAGGFTQEARASDLKIIKQGTHVWLDPQETVVEDGDQIWVPRVIHRPFGEYLVSIAQVATVLSAVVAIALLAKTYSK